MKTLFLLLFIYALHITALAEDNEPLQKSLNLRSYPKKVSSYISKKPKLLHRRFHKKTYSAKLVKVKDDHLKNYTVFPPQDNRRRLIDIPNSPYFPLDMNDEPKARVKKVLPDYNEPLQRRKRAADPEPQPPPIRVPVFFSAPPLQVRPIRPTFLAGPPVAAAMRPLPGKVALSAGFPPGLPRGVPPKPAPPGGPNSTPPAALADSTTSPAVPTGAEVSVADPAAAPASTPASATAIVKKIAKKVKKPKKRHSKAGNKTTRIGRKKQSSKKGGRNARSKIQSKKSRIAKRKGSLKKARSNKRHSDKKKKSGAKPASSARRENKRRAG